MINAKNIIKKILREWGHDILYQRRISDDFTYSEVLERITTRSQLAKSSRISSTLEEETEGYFVNSDLVYYFESSVNPQSGDRIYEESFTNLDETIIYRIDAAYGVRGRFGEINYWIVGATKETPAG
jgi:hypothetical protein